jgi:hypothetical protein
MDPLSEVSAIKTIRRLPLAAIPQDRRSSSTRWDLTSRNQVDQGRKRRSPTAAGIARSVAPLLHSGFLVHELERVGLLVVETGGVHSCLHHRIEKILAARAVIAPIPRVFASPEVTIPFSFRARMESSFIFKV